MNDPIRRRNNSMENKISQHVLSSKFDSGFILGS